VAIARDYWRLITGRLTGVEMRPEDAKIEMKKHRNTRYDGEVLDLLLNADDIGSSPILNTALQASQLEEDMVLAQNLYNENHILILPEGHVFNQVTIDKLRLFERKQGKPFTIEIEQENAAEEKSE
jgi:hypothetical protein